MVRTPESILNVCEGARPDLAQGMLGLGCWRSTENTALRAAAPRLALSLALSQAPERQSSTHKGGCFSKPRFLQLENNVAPISIYKNVGLYVAQTTGPVDCSSSLSRFWTQ